MPKNIDPAHRDIKSNICSGLPGRIMCRIEANICSFARAAAAKKAPLPLIPL